jgi:hypothetical protein
MKIRTILVSFLLFVGFHHNLSYCQPVYFNKALDLGGIFGVGHSILENDSGYYISGVVGGGKINIGFISLDLFGNQTFIKSYGEVGTDYYDGRPGSLKKIEDTYTWWIKIIF